MPNKNQLKEARVYSDLKYAVVKKKWWPMHKAAGHIAYTLMKQRTGNGASPQSLKLQFPPCSDPLPPVRLCLLKLQPSQTVPPSANQLFKYGSLWRALHIQKHNIDMVQVPK